MSAAIAVRKGGSTVTHADTAVYIEATGLDANDPADDGVALLYHIECTKSGQDPLVSETFSGEEFSWQGVVFPAAGTWAYKVIAEADDSTVVTHNLVVA